MNREEIRNCEFAVYRKTGEAVSINYVDGRDNVRFFEIHKDRWPVIASDDENIGRPEDFDECPYETISPDAFGRLVRAEIRCEDLLKSHSFLPLFTVEGEYKTAAEDLLEGLNRLFEEQWTAEKFMKWFNVIASNFNVIGYDEEYEFRRIRTLNENELLCYAILDLKFEYDCFEDFDDTVDLEFFEKPSYTLKMLLSNRGKDIKDWQIPEEIPKLYVLDQDNDDSKLEP